MDTGTERLFAWATWIIGRLEDNLTPALSGMRVLRL
ncbi:hypothetical protein ENSA7_47820 [Enhygromyxa salina]|uniref:Uncharacterized protein n=1 Tax=Enhygromyxa salina TaxID=215803 RepID=A0A2S9YJ72_9BACT|nr:hypothetical protein ENSA7_47820 [Enhygromyxa salina]